MNLTEAVRSVIDGLPIGAEFTVKGVNNDFRT
jgi:hypothetical protein